MTRGFLSSIVGMALVAVLIVTTGVNCWQTDRLERRTIDLQDELDQLKKSGVRSASHEAAGGPRSYPPEGGAEPSYVTAAFSDPRNVLERDPSPILPPGTPAGGTLNLHLGSDPKGFNFLIENGSDVTEIQEFVGVEMIKRHRRDTTRWGPSFAYFLAEDPAPDGSITYTYKTRKDFYWHEPDVDWASGRYEWLRGDHRVTARDVVFMLDMVMNEQVTKAAPLRSYFSDLVAYDAPDDDTLVLKFSRRTYDQRAILVPSIYPMPRFLYAYDEEGNLYEPDTLGQSFQDHWYNPRGIGCGAYKLGKVDVGVAIRLLRNPEFPLGGNAFDEVIYSILSDQNQPPRMLRTAELDLAYLQPGQFRTEVLEGSPDSPFKDGTLAQGEFWEHSWFYVGWNLRKPMFQDKRVRWALSHAFNGARLLNDVFMGLGELTSGPMPSFLPWYDRSIPPVPFDLARAAALLEEAGWVDTDGDGIRDKELDGKRVPFEFSLLSYGSSDEYRSLGNIFKEDLSKIGVKMNPAPAEWSNLLKQVEDREFDAVTLAWVGSPDVDFKQIWGSEEADAPKSSNHVGFKSAEADEIIEGLKLAFDPEERRQLAFRFHKLIYDEQPYTIFYTRKRPVFWSKQLQDVSFALVRPYRNHRSWFRAAP